MDELRIGDRVLSAGGDGALLCDTVFLLGAGSAATDYVRIEAGNATLELTPGHYLHAGPTCCSHASLKRAGDVEAGDVVHLTASGRAKPTVVTAVARR